MRSNIDVPIFAVNRKIYILSMHTKDMSIGSRIKSARQEAKLTQTQLAAKVGLAQPTISDLESGESEGTGSIATIASALGVNALWLETGKGEKKPRLPDFSDAAELLSLYGLSTAAGREQILLAAKAAEKII